MPQNIKLQFIKLLQMQKYNIADFFGEYERNSSSPNTFTCKPLNVSLVLRVRPNPLPHQTKYYLVYRVGTGKAQYLSALWSSNSTAQSGMNEYVITDTQGVRGSVLIDMFRISLRKS